jgi:branched-chain amino acid transport system substrate-binding protein
VSRHAPATVAVLCVAALLGVANAGPVAEPGVPSRTVLLGGTVPLTGAFSNVAGIARGAEAYFRYLNARGGVNGRAIAYRYYDDQGDPSLTAELTRRLVEEDRVFAVFNAAGIKHNLAVRPFLNAVGVPQLFVASGLSDWGVQHGRFPWTMGYQPSYADEGVIYGKHVGHTRPRARIGILFQNDEYGRDLVAGLRRGLGTKAAQIKGREGYAAAERDVSARVARLRARGVDTLMIFASRPHAVQALQALDRLRWRPALFVSHAAASTGAVKVGAVSIGFVKDPADSRWRDDPGMELYLRIMRRHLPTVSVRDRHYVYGMAVAFTMVDALRRAGPSLTRRSLLRSATRLHERNNPFLLPGITVRTTPNDRFPIRQAQLERYSSGGRWVAFGGLVSARG